MRVSSVSSNPLERVAWLNDRDPFHAWFVGEVIVCGHCERSFKSQDFGTFEDEDGELPCCPFCEATPMDFWPWERWQDRGR